MYFWIPSWNTLPMSVVALAKLVGDSSALVSKSRPESPTAPVTAVEQHISVGASVHFLCWSVVDAKKDELRAVLLQAFIVDVLHELPGMVDGQP
jgi:hypothetical protein